MRSCHDVDRHRIRRYLLTAAGGVCILGALYLVLVFVAVTRAANDAQSARATGEAIVVLGAAQYNGQPSPVLQVRLEGPKDLSFDVFVVHLKSKYGGAEESGKSERRKETASGLHEGGLRSASRWGVVGTRAGGTPVVR